MPRITKNNPLTNYISREEIARIHRSIETSVNRKPTAPCLLCGQPVTWEMWTKFTPCPTSKSGKSGHMKNAAWKLRRIAS
jgi:hypothetical protein